MKNNNRNRIGRVVFALFFFAIFSAGCGGTITGEFSDPAKPVNVKLGDKFTISLESNRTTGYTWQLAEQPDRKMLQFRGTKYITGDTKTVGAGGFEKWVFTAAKKGRTTLSFNYRRPWENAVPPAKKAVFYVTIE